VYRSGVNIATVTSTSFSNLGLSAGTQYCYTVAAYNSAGASAQCAQVCAITTAAVSVPAVPTGLTATAASSSQINLSWAAASGASGYYVYRSGVNIATITSTSFSNLGLSAATQYCYTVAAYNSAGSSAQCPQVCATTSQVDLPPSATLTAPANGALVSGTITTSATASDSDGTSVARIEMYCDNGLIGTVYSGSYSAGFSTTGLANGNHSFYAKAYDTVGNSATSATATVNVSNSAGPGTTTWASGFGGTGSDGGYAVTVDSSGNIYTAGWFSGAANFGGASLTSAGGQDIFLTKSSTSGSLLWARRYGGSGDETVTSIGLDSSGNIFLGGYFTGTGNFGGANFTSAGSSDIFLAKYDASGNPLWSQTFGGTDLDALYGLDVDGQGNVVITGSFRQTVNIGGGLLYSILGGDTGFVAKYSPSGAYVWGESFSGASANYGRGVAVDGTGNIYVTGYFFSSFNCGGGLLNALSSAANIFVAKFSSTGGYLWSKVHGDSNTVKALGLAVDANSNVLVTGEFHSQTDLGGGTVLGSALYTDVFVAKYAGADGSFTWAQVIKGNMGAEPAAIATDAQNNVVVTGYYYGTYTFGNTTLSSLSGSYDAFVTKYSGTGGAVWTRSYGGTGTDQGFGVIVDSAGYPVVTGAFSGSATIGGGTLNAAGSYDCFIERISP
jgi:uncharacterized protein YccT (UPF0319 family)